MRLAITTSGPELHSPVEPRLGRARFFRIVDLETGQQLPVDNAGAVNAVQGAGTQAVKILARLGVEVLLTGHIGPKARRALQAANIRVYSVDGSTGEEVVQAFVSGRLQALSSANNPGP